MPEKILIPLDGSKLGEAALHYVEELIFTLSAKQKIEVILLQIFSPPTTSFESDGEHFNIPLTGEEMVPIKEESMDYLERTAENLRRKGANVTCKAVAQEASVSAAEEIINTEEKYHVDMVAMSTHGRRGLSKWAFGSVTDKVLQAGKVPVLVVRAGKEL